MQTKFINAIIIVTLILAIIIAAIKLFLPQVFTPVLLPLALFLIFSLSFISFRIFLKLIQKTPKKFAGYYMIFAFGKMILHLIIMLTLAFLIKSQAIPLLIWYGIIFLIFTVIETIYTFKISKNI